MNNNLIMISILIGVILLIGFGMFLGYTLNDDQCQSVKRRLEAEYKSDIYTAKHEGYIRGQVQAIKGKIDVGIFTDAYGLVYYQDTVNPFHLYFYESEFLIK